MGTRPPIVRLDSTQLNFVPARVGALLFLFFLLLTCPGPASVPSSRSTAFGRPRLEGKQGSLDAPPERKLVLLGHQQCPDMRPGTWVPGYWGTWLRAPRHKLRVAGTSLSRTSARCAMGLVGTAGICGPWSRACQANAKNWTYSCSVCVCMYVYVCVCVCVFFQSSVYHLYPVHSHFCYIARYIDCVPPWVRKLYHRRVSVSSCMRVGAQYRGGPLCTIQMPRELVARLTHGKVADGSLLQR